MSVLYKEIRPFCVPCKKSKIIGKMSQEGLRWVRKKNEVLHCSTCCLDAYNILAYRVVSEQHIGNNIIEGALKNINKD